jgi:hypothetical protein
MRIHTRFVIAAALLGLAAPAVHAAQPEISRPVGTPQANGVLHTVRAIPEACAWLQGTFTGDAKAPYRFSPVRSSATCQPRARFVDVAKAKPSQATGWKFNDLIRVPSKDCPGLQAVVEVWRKPVASAPPKLDAQGRARLYLQEAKQNAASAPAVTMYAARVSTEGRACR